MKLVAIPGLLLAVLSTGITSCSIVTSKQIVGDEPVDDPGIGIVSHWLDSDGVVVSVSFDEEEPGRLHMTSECEELDLQRLGFVDIDLAGRMGRIDNLNMVALNNRLSDPSQNDFYHYNH